jgi:dolichyl-diphosphooligosaccharide--protein glycosyltransferase
MYSHYLNLPLQYSWLGGGLLFFYRTNGAYFVFLYAFIATHFSSKMSRLVLICGPICAIGCGMFFGWVADHLLEPFLLLLGKKGYKAPAGFAAASVSNLKKRTESDSEARPSNGSKKGKETPSVDGKKSKDAAKPSSKKKSAASSWDSAGQHVPLASWEEDYRPGGVAQIKRVVKSQLMEAVPADVQEKYYALREKCDSSVHFLLGRASLSIIFVLYMFFTSSKSGPWVKYINHCESIAQGMSTAGVKYNVPQRDGSVYLVDDYWKGYRWVAENTPKDSRVMAWWDYGYHITGIAERTSIADGNTWNHEHIATLGKMMTSPQKKAHNAIKHLADYVLVWAGGRSDDLAKSPHLARIGNSVFTDHCGDDDPRCSKFSFYGSNYDEPTPMMKESLLYNLVKHNKVKGARAYPSLFQEVHETKHGLMRIFKVMNVSMESKNWIADPENKLCDAPGSWYCVGQYPPALDKLIQKRKSFSQVEDFNKKGEKSAYTKLIEKERSGKKEL